MADGDPVRRVLLAVLGGAWGLRLSGYLLKNRVLTGEEDGRYQMLREKWGRQAQWFFLVFFQIQAVWAVMFAVPFLPVVFSMVPALGWWDIAAVAVWLVAVGGESLADWQLARFRANPENCGKTCREGLWRYRRIPHAWRLARAVRDAVHRAAVRRLDRNPRDVGAGADGLGPVVPAVGGRTVLVRRH